MSDASLLGDFIGSVIEGGEKKKAVRPASVGEVVHPGSFGRHSSVPPDRPSSGALCPSADSGFCPCWQASSRASLFAESEEFLKNLPEGVRILSGQLHVPVLV
jgi:hypothetical protein